MELSLVPRARPWIPCRKCLTPSITWNEYSFKTLDQNVISDVSASVDSDFKDDGVHDDGMAVATIISSGTVASAPCVGRFPVEHILPLSVVIAP